MPTYKATMVFNQNREGWSESWYITVADIATAKARGLDLAKLRSKMLGRGSTLEAIRYSDVDIPRICALVIPGDIPDAGADFITDVPWTGALANICAQDLYRRSMIFRGVPDDWVTYDAFKGFDLIPPALLTPFKAFCDELKARSWQLKAILKTGGNLVGTTISDINDDGNGFVSLPLAGFTGIVGDTLKMAKWAGPDQKILNRSYLIKKNDGTNVVISLRSDALTDSTANSGGKAFPQAKGYVIISDCSLERFVKRNTGRAFFVPRGRRRKA